MKKIGRIFVRYDTGGFIKSCEQIQVQLHETKMPGTLCKTYVHLSTALVAIVSMAAVDSNRKR